MFPKGSPDMSKHNAVFSETRSDYFRPSWFVKLFGGKLSLGDTFWAGTYGAIMLFTPIWFAIYLTVTIAAPERIALVQTAIYIFAPLYCLPLFLATFSVAKRSPGAGSWRWVAVGHNAILAVVTVWLAWKMLF